MNRTSPPAPAPLCGERSGADFPADLWARRGAWLAVVGMALALLWVGLTLFRPAPASAATPEPDLSSTIVADLPSARSTR